MKNLCIICAFKYLMSALSLAAKNDIFVVCSDNLFRTSGANGSQSIPGSHGVATHELCARYEVTLGVCRALGDAHTTQENEIDQIGQLIRLGMRPRSPAPSELDSVASDPGEQHLVLNAAIHQEHTQQSIDHLSNTVRPDVASDENLPGEFATGAGVDVGDHEDFPFRKACAVRVGASVPIVALLAGVEAGLFGMMPVFSLVFPCTKTELDDGAALSSGLLCRFCNRNVCAERSESGTIETPVRECVPRVKTGN